ncbi:MAG TPA: phosphomannomutase/phosphoglucomutase [Kofleriaceae bacterium]|nr:phosphomannomutase/phosphoglucomutase [Kofleriaceae bacterium]
MNPQVFREYDIRGVADRDLDDDFVCDLGRAFATYLRARADKDALTVAIGRDPRLTSPRLRAAFTRGITELGVDVIDIGVVPTPILYFSAFHFATDGAVMITGSHNPPADNGFKLLREKTSLFGDDVRALRDIILSRSFAAAPEAAGTITERDAVTPYLSHATSKLRLGDRRFKVVVDAGNGAGGPAGVALYRALGFEVIDLYCEMDGAFPNHHPDPTVPANIADLRQRVLDEGAALGIAFDGDADRLGAIDNHGRTLWGDQIMILLGRAILDDCPGASFIGEVKCSQALYDELEKAGGHPIMWKVGHSLIKAKMKESGALLGGEMSGHIFFANRYLGFDDAIYAGARLLEILSHTEKTLGDLYDTLPVMVNTPEIRIDCPDDIKFAVVSRVTDRLRARSDVQSVVDVDGVRARVAGGWGLVRASNTQPALVVRCEADSETRLAEILASIQGEVAAARTEVAP